MWSMCRLADWRSSEKTFRSPYECEPDPAPARKRATACVSLETADPRWRRKLRNWSLTWRAKNREFVILFFTDRLIDWKRCFDSNSSKFDSVSKESSRCNVSTTMQPFTGVSRTSRQTFGLKFFSQNQFRHFAANYVTKWKKIDFTISRTWLEVDFLNAPLLCSRLDRFGNKTQIRLLLKTCRPRRTSTKKRFCRTKRILCHSIYF